MKRTTTLLSLAVIGLSACASNSAGSSSAIDDITLARMLSGQSAMQGSSLENAVEKASQYPLGSQRNPVRAHMPPGQRAYLSRLRCADLTRPEFYRAGSAGMSPYSNIVDLYIVTCEGSEPAKSEIYIDMYHAGYVETEAVPGFGITGGTTAE